VLRDGIRLYFIRHGETDWNAAQRYQGRRDIPLNAKGRLQARRNGRVLANLLGSGAASLDYVASPLLRARETMEILRAELMLSPTGYRTDDRICEIDYGHWEGRLWAELPSTDPVGYAARKADPWGWQPTGGESYRMLSQRIAQWLSAVERDTVVASHGGVSKALRGLVLQLPNAEIPHLEVWQDKVLLVSTASIRWL